MTNGEAVKILHEILSNHTIEALQLAMASLEKQMPKKPDLEGDGYGDDGELIYDTGYCPDCRCQFEVDYDVTDYCPECGQALDWSDVND